MTDVHIILIMVACALVFAGYVALCEAVRQ
jgi:hypothetical protein